MKHLMRAGRCPASALVFGSLLLLPQLGCYSVSYFPGGYQRQGVWLPKKSPRPYRPKDHIEVAGHDLDFDPSLGVYVVADRDGCYYVGGQFYCRYEEGWGIGSGPDEPLAAIPETQVPPGLRSLGSRGSCCSYRPW